MFNVTNVGIPSVARRDWLQFGLMGALGLAVGQPEVRAAPLDRSFGRAKRCIQVFLNGGLSQLDSWDMKPEAPAEVRGELSPIATAVAGIQISELFPQMAQQLDKVKVVRTVSHAASVHTTGVYTMLTGTHHATPNLDQTRITPNDHPHLGSIVASHRGSGHSMPQFLSLPMLFQAPPVEGIWPGQNAGFLGPRYDPFVITGDKQTACFHVPAMNLPPDLFPQRFSARRELLGALDSESDWGSGAGPVKRLLWDEAFSLLSRSGIGDAINLSREPASSLERYGNHLFGRGLLSARRLVEAGETFVTVYWVDPTPAGAGGGEFDSHGRLYWHLRNRLAAPADKAIAALISDLWDRGLHEDTLLIVMSEFGRTPRINADAGRDHWPHTQSILLGGAGISGGTVHGATDHWAAYPITDPVSPPDLAQSILHLVGVPSQLELHDRLDRPIFASSGKVDNRLIS